MNSTLPIGPFVLSVSTDHWQIHGWRFGIVLGGDGDGIGVHVAAMTWELNLEVLRRYL